MYITQYKEIDAITKKELLKGPWLWSAKLPKGKEAHIIEIRFVPGAPNTYEGNIYMREKSGSIHSIHLIPKTNLKEIKEGIKKDLAKRGFKEVVEEIKVVDNLSLNNNKT